jgi:uncharacterized protein YybS (DUF2232 family)
VASQGDAQPELFSIISTIFLVSLALILPGIQWSLFGWLYILLPLLTFYVLGKFGPHVGNKILLTAAVISLGGNLIFGSFDLFLFSAVMVVTGAVLHRSAVYGESPSVSGVKGCLSLAAGWFIVVTIAGAGAEVSVYGQMLQNLDNALTETMDHYRQSGTVTADTLVVIEATIYQMKVVIPLILPGIIGSVILLIIWTTMALGNTIAAKYQILHSWPTFRHWQLPEKLIWAVIAMGIFTILPAAPLPKIGINGLLLLSVLYCFQGLSVTVFFMNKWKVPLFLRAFFYVMIVFQSLGTLILLLVGLADIWIDFRKLKSDAAPGNH